MEKLACDYIENSLGYELKDGVVTVQMRGACSGCPSSTMTLKAGIEALLKRLLPDDVKEVVSEAV